MRAAGRFLGLPAGGLFRDTGSMSDNIENGSVIGGNAAGMLQYELVSVRPARTPVGFASLSTSALAQQRQQEAAAVPAGRRLFSQVPLFDLARAAAAVETGMRVIKMAGDGRCMFRALAQGLARNQGRFLGKAAEEQEADQLRLAVMEALCRTAKRRNEFASAVFAVEAEDKLPNYCRRIAQPTFWGGEVELLVLSQMLRTPIRVYLLPTEGSGGGRYQLLVEYGSQFAKTKSGKQRRPVRLLYTQNNHYDLLVK